MGPNGEKKTKVIAEKSLAIVTDQQYEGTQLELHWSSLMSLAKENGWAKDKEDMAKL